MDNVDKLGYCINFTKSQSFHFKHKILSPFAFFYYIAIFKKSQIITKMVIFITRLLHLRFLADSDRLSLYISSTGLFLLIFIRNIKISTSSPVESIYKLNRAVFRKNYIEIIIKAFFPKSFSNSISFLICFLPILIFLKSHILYCLHNFIT